jgi:hypothetical protein
MKKILDRLSHDGKISNTIRFSRAERIIASFILLNLYGIIYCFLLIKPVINIPKCIHGSLKILAVALYAECRSFAEHDELTPQVCIHGRQSFRSDVNMTLESYE